MFRQFLEALNGNSVIFSLIFSSDRQYMYILFNYLSLKYIERHWSTISYIVPCVVHKSTNNEMSFDLQARSGMSGGSGGRAPLKRTTATTIPVTKSFIAKQ